MTAFQTSTEDLSATDAERYSDLTSWISEAYPEASRQDRARMVKELLGYGAKERRIRMVDVAWVRLDSMLVRSLYVEDSYTGGSILTIEDDTTGVYVALLSETKGKNIGSLIQDLLASGPDGADTARLVKEIDEAGRNRELMVEVNGVSMYFDKQGTSPEEILDSSLELLWRHLPEGDGRDRIEMAIPVIWKAILDKELFGALRLGWATNPEATPHDLCLTRGAGFENGQRGGSLVDLEGPPADVLERFFGKPELPLPDPDMPFEKLRQKLF